MYLFIYLNLQFASIYLFIFTICIHLLWEEFEIRLEDIPKIKKCNICNLTNLI